MYILCFLSETTTTKTLTTHDTDTHLHLHYKICIGYLLYKETPALVQLSTESFENSLITASGFFPLLIIVLSIILLKIILIAMKFNNI